MFVDEARVSVKSGKGGDGAVTLHREKYRPNGGPDGGDGGRGGSVILVADLNIGSLVALRDHPHQKASNGTNGAKNNRTGANAQDLLLVVPVGTVVKDEQGTVIADLARSGDSVVAAKGGRGGRGNAAFKTHTRRLPSFGELGEPGESLVISLELRLIADVAVIGFPNAGKSTIVGAVSAARPKVADYAFTTLEPTLGIVETEGHRFTICDIPGLIEGAHTGKGLGLEFLRHAARAPVFLHLIDLTATERDPVGDHEVIRNELRKFREDLAERPIVVALNKIDTVAPDVVDKAKSCFEEAFPISARDGDGLPALLAELRRLVDAANEAAANVQGFELFRPAEIPLTVKREDSAWRVEGASVRRWVSMTDMSNPEAVAYLQDRLERSGVEKALAEAGASHGDEVRIGPVEFEWWPAGSAPADPIREGKRR
ncbi:MAG: GTPase ObgE [Actinomycetota bacterium]